MITLTETKRNTTGTEFTVETHVLDRGTWYAVRFKDQQLPCGWAGTVNEAYADLLHWRNESRGFWPLMTWRSNKSRSTQGNGQ